MKRPDLNDFEVEYPDEKMAYLDYEEYQKALEKHIDYLEKIRYIDDQVIKDYQTLIETLQRQIKIQNA